MPTPITRDGPEAAPYAYVLASSEEFTPQAISAVFDGSGAGGDFLPCCSVYTQNGQLVSRDFPSTVTAGDSAEVTYHPFLRAATSVTPVTGTRLPWCLAEGDLPTDSSLPSYFTFDTKDSSVYQLDAGSTHVQIIGAGLFVVTVSASIETNAFAATTVLDLDCAFTAPHGINYLQNIGSNGWVNVGHSSGGTPIWNNVQQFIVSNNSGNTHTLRAQLSSNPAGTDNADHYVFIQRIDDAYGSPL